MLSPVEENTGAKYWVKLDSYPLDLVFVLQMVFNLLGIVELSLNYMLLLLLLFDLYLLGLNAIIVKS
jgi:hypothetical protein